MTCRATLLLALLALACRSECDGTCPERASAHAWAPVHRDVVGDLVFTHRGNTWLTVDLVRQDFTNVESGASSTAPQEPRRANGMHYKGMPPNARPYIIPDDPALSPLSNYDGLDAETLPIADWLPVREPVRDALARCERWCEQSPVVRFEYRDGAMALCACDAGTPL